MDVSDDNNFSIDSDEIGLGRKYGPNSSHNFMKTFFWNLSTFKEVVFDQVVVDLPILEHPVDA